MKIEFLKPGAFVDGHGQKVDITSKMIDEVYETYDPNIFEAPVVIGHPRHNDPAFGWVQQLAKGGGRLTATAEPASPIFTTWLNQKLYKKISASLFPPNVSSNPHPGKWSLRHIGFLGAAAPAIPGLKLPEFSGDEEGCLTVELEFSEAITEMDKKEQELQLREQKLQAREQALQKREFTSFCEGLAQEKGNPLPCKVEEVVEFMVSISTTPEAIEFSAGDEKVKAIDWFKGFLKDLPKAIDFREVSASKDSVDAASPEVVGQKAQEYVDEQKAKGKIVSFTEAVNVVEGRIKG